MTLHELADELRRVAYNLDDTSRKWDANDQAFARIEATVSGLSAQLRQRTAEVARLQRQVAVWKCRAKVGKPARKRT